jgi:hypothetical protein
MFNDDFFPYPLIPIGSQSLHRYSHDREIITIGNKSANGRGESEMKIFRHWKID